MSIDIVNVNERKGSDGSETRSLFVLCLHTLHIYISCTGRLEGAISLGIPLRVRVHQFGSVLKASKGENEMLSKRSTPKRLLSRLHFAR